MPKKTGAVLMTALLPTKGHKYLIDFSRKFLGKDGKLDVIICSRSKEPIPGRDRCLSLLSEYDAYFHDAVRQRGECVVNIHHWTDDFAPQNPDDHPEFWEYWREVIHKFSHEKVDYVFASETYGIEVAKAVNAEFISCDIARQILDVKSSDVREDIETYFGDILPSMQKHFKQTVTFFGAESTGKTTMSREFNNSFLSYYVPEWAREYLETVGSDLNEDKMRNIMKGQYAAQTAVGDMLDRPYVFQDTDLLSTIGYYRISGIPMPLKIVDLFKTSKSSLYVVMNSKIPFVPDPLRYGGDVRESTDQFWIDLLEEFGCNYHVVQSTNFDDQFMEIHKAIAQLWQKFEPIAEFERE